MSNRLWPSLTPQSGTKPLYVLLAYEEQTHIITVHWLDPDKGLNPKTRR